jgi:hypothetical protein
LIAIKARLAAAPDLLPVRSGRRPMTLYLAGVIATFAAFMITLFAVSTCAALKK